MKIKRLKFNFLIIFTVIAKSYCDRACNRNTCLNGGTCTVNDETRVFQCDCPLGFSGLLCQDNCSLHCLHGSCIKGTFNVESCQCFEGWMGSLCDISVVEDHFCNPPCTREERCVTNSTDNYICQLKETQCTNFTCQNNGTCVSDNNDVKCVCSPGFQGKACEQDVDECLMGKCKNGGSCRNLYGDYQCVCPSGFDGKNCENKNQTICADGFCKNGGSCVLDNNTFVCKCPEKFEGKHCEFESKNDSIQPPTTSEIPCFCENPRHRCELINGSASCSCSVGFTGPNCDILNSNPCSTDPCLNGGICVEEENDFTCFCLPQWSGTYCNETVECLVNGKACENGGKCVFSLVMTSCECLDGYSGSNCENKPSTIATYNSHMTCNDFRCQNGGSCLIDTNGEPYCKCADGFDSPLCEPSSGCLLNPCQNGGTCQDADGQYFCHCKNGFIGVHCESLESTITTSSTIDLNFSTNINPPGNDFEMTCDDCVNFSKCLELENSQITCICKEGYFGKKCTKKYNKCSTKKCSKGEICRQILDSDNQNITAICTCPLGHFGQNCELITSATFSKQSLYIHQSSKFSLGESSYDKLNYELEFSFRTTVEDVHLVSSENILGEKILITKLSGGYLIFNISGAYFDKILPIQLNDAEWYNVKIKNQQQETKIEVKNENGSILATQHLNATLDVFLTRFGKVSSNHFFTGCLADVRVDNQLLTMTESKSAVDIRRGCTRSEQCSREYCQNNGVCIDHWESSSCKCAPPYLKPNCAFSLPKTTFGNLDRPTFVHLTTNEKENHLLRNNIDLSFLIRTHKSFGHLFYIGEKRSNADNPLSYVDVELEKGLLLVKYQSGGRRETSILSKNRLDDNEEHFVQIKINRNRRQILIDNLKEIDEPNYSRMSQEFFVDDIFIGSSASSNEYFKGYLQDIQLNAKSIVIHSTPLTIDSIGQVENVTNVLENAISDPVCDNSVCKYGECIQLFNSYRCECADGFTGPNCDRTDFCKTATCMNGSRCENTENKFYCVFPVTLSSESIIYYNLQPQKSIVNIPKIAFSLRTHSTNGHLFTLKQNSNVIKVMMEARKITIIGKKMMNKLPTVSDGKWHNIILSPFKLQIDEQKFIPTQKLFGFDENTAVDLIIGKDINESIFSCLDNFTIGEYPTLSFTKINITTDNDNWKLIEKVNVGTGCISADQCGIFSTCLNGAECIDIWNKSQCKCAPGFTGEHCEININECEFLDCGNNGYCHDEIDKARCVCNNGFSGENCEIVNDECQGQKCFNDGKCVSINGTISCQCEDQWMGKHCNISKTNDCNQNPCQNFGKCEQLTNTTFECNCVDNFSGPLCENQLGKKCDHRDCNHGHCVLTVTGPACECEFGYTGRFCEKFLDHCTSNTCSSRGYCSSAWNSTYCNCNENWRGSHCQYSSDPCLKFPCKNDGVCGVTDDGNFKCECQKHYMGSRCEIEGSCLKAKCVHGECIQQSADRHLCSCNIGYEGDFCDKRVDYCKSKPCLNNGACENMLTGHRCHCLEGFKGSDCEIDIDECQLGFCRNGAICRDKINDYECDCDETGYEGRNCTIDVNECENPYKCVKGKCTNTIGSYKCSCENGFIGPRCSIKNPCLEQLMQNNISRSTCVHGKCVNPVVLIEKNKEVARYECACEQGYTGPTCSQKIKEAELSNIGYLFGPIVVIVIVFLILGCLLLIFVVKGNNAMHGHYSPSSHEFNQNRMMPTVVKLPPQERLI